MITKNGKTYFLLNLQPLINGKMINFSRLDVQDSMYIFSSEEHSFRAIIHACGDQFAYWIDGVTGHIKEITYFHNSYANISLLRSFSSDYHNFYTDWEKSYTEIKSQVLPPEEERGGKIRTWALTPQPRSFTVKLCYLTEEQNPWFGFSIPGPLPVCSTICKLVWPKALKIEFKDYYADNFNHQLPKVFFYDNLEDSYTVLNKHCEITQSLGYCQESKVFYDWWNRPILSPSADVYESCRFIEDGKFEFDVSSETLLEYISHIEEKTECSDFTVLIDGYWFQNPGNYFLVADNIFGDARHFRKFIDKLHAKNHKVLLWLAHFNTYGPLPPNITDEMLLQNEDYRLFDYTYPEVRDYIKSVIHFMLSSDVDCLDADGIKLDYGYVTPDINKRKFFDSSWGVGDQLRFKVNRFILDCAHAVKTDAFVSDTCIEPCIPLDVIRLNDEWGENIDIWVERARKAISVKNTIIDTDGFWMHANKFKHYCMLAPVIGIPSFYCSKKFFSFEPLSEIDYRRLNSSWNVYNHSPVTPDMQININQAENLYYRVYAKGPLAGFYSAISINGHCLVTYTKDKALVASAKRMTVEIPMPPGFKIKEVLAKTWENTYETFSYIEGIAKDTILMAVDDVGVWYRWIEIIFE